MNKKHRLTHSFVSLNLVLLVTMLASFNNAQAAERMVLIETYTASW